MDIFRAIILGIVQGLSEPLPISSSAHLLLLPWILDWPEHSLTFDVALHGGTALAILVYFWGDWLELVRAFFSSLRDRSLAGDYHRKLVWYIVVASIPAALAGLLFESTIEEILRAPIIVAPLLILMGIVLIIADRTTSHSRSLSEIRLSDAVIIGLAQTLALIPGVSRSGITITMGLFRQMSRADAARFSFLMSGPIVMGAFLYKMLGLLRTGLPQGEAMAFLVGIAVATLVGYGAIRFLLVYVQKNSFDIFVYYRLAFGGIVLALLLFRG